MRKGSRIPGFGSRLLRGLTSFEVRVVALLLLLFLVFPAISRADTEDMTLEILSPNVTVRGGVLNLTAVVRGERNFTLSWILPPGFEPLGPVESRCAGSCNSTLSVFVNGSLPLGPHDIGVEASHA